jgi:hypothetical protein
MPILRRLRVTRDASPRRIVDIGSRHERFFSESVPNLYWRFVFGLSTRLLENIPHQLVMSANTEMDLDGSMTSHFQFFDASRESYDPLLAALRTAQEEYSLSNPKSSQAHEEACLDFPGGNTRTVIHASPFPMTFGELDIHHLHFSYHHRRPRLTLNAGSPWERG